MGKLLVDIHQVVAATGLRAQVGDGQGVHGGELELQSADEEQQDQP